MTPEQIAEGRRLKADLEKEWEKYLGSTKTPVASTPGAFEKVNAAEHDWGEWLANNIYALLAAAERAAAAKRELAEVRGDSERFEWWFNRDVDKRDFMPTYFQGIRERWSLSNWRAAIDAERGK